MVCLMALAPLAAIASLPDQELNLHLLELRGTLPEVFNRYAQPCTELTLRPIRKTERARFVGAQQEFPVTRQPLDREGVDEDIVLTDIILIDSVSNLLPGDCHLDHHPVAVLRQLPITLYLRPVTYPVAFLRC